MFVEMESISNALTRIKGMSIAQNIAVATEAYLLARRRIAREHRGTVHGRQETARRWQGIARGRRRMAGNRL